MNTFTAIGMALLFVIGLYLLIVTVFIIGMFLYKFILGATIRKIPQEEFPAYLISGYFTHKKRWLYFTLFFFGFHSAIYMQQRIELIGNNRAYPEAKEYFASAGVVTLYRKTLNNYFNIDDPIMRPINAIHMKFYDKGIAFIPKTDGEYDYWKYRFDLYYYVRKLYVPWDKDKSGYLFGAIVYKHYKPVIRNLMDESFQTMTGLMEKPIKDPLIAHDDRYKTFTRLVVFYEMHILNVNSLECSSIPKCMLSYSKDLLLINRDKKVLSLINIADKALGDKSIKDKITHQIDVLMATAWISGRQVNAFIGNNSLECINPTVRQYINVHEQFDMLSKTSDYLKLPSSVRNNHYEKNFISLKYGSTCNIVINHKCKTSLNDTVCSGDVVKTESGIKKEYHE